ncbi:MAG TPA: methyltransferase domain-containing protein [Pirellulaceae bacterium]|nr:methyltransferase domain-containing protein [Pirellulaceae bacterium]
MSDERRADWQLPPGVDPGTWEYVHNRSIAYDYDRYFDGHALFAWDRELLARCFPEVPAGSRTIADLGCGTGRALEFLVERGYDGLAIDLSPLMLEVVRDKTRAGALPIRRLCANLVELDGVRGGSVDHAVCLFSTLGMIRGRTARRRALEHIARILVPGGTFVVHVHNLWANARFPGGLRWLASTWWRSRRDPSWEWGDKLYAYRGLGRMFLHVFRQHEIEADLRAAGFFVRETMPLDAKLTGPLPRGTWAARWRASGWTIRCETSTERGGSDRAGTSRR